MKTSPSRRFRRAGSLVTAALLVCGLAISSGAENSELPDLTPQSLFQYLQQDLLVHPGIGFDKVRIGHTFEQVLKSWGNPNKAYDSDVGSKTAWVYRISRDSEIAVSGRTTVESIEITGNFNSPFSSAEGVGFGMTAHQVIAVYGKPSGSASLAKLRYPERGISFRFENGVLRSMRIYPAG